MTSTHLTTKGVVRLQVFILVVVTLTLSVTAITGGYSFWLVGFLGWLIKQWLPTRA